jgi:hypothetical protein
LKDVGGGEGLDEGAGLLGVGFVEDDGGDLANVGVDCVAEEEELEDGDEEREEEGGGVAEDVGEFFAGYGLKAEESCAARTAILGGGRAFDFGWGGVMGESLVGAVIPVWGWLGCDG